MMTNQIDILQEVMLMFRGHKNSHLFFYSFHVPRKTINTTAFESLEKHHLVDKVSKAEFGH